MKQDDCWIVYDHQKVGTLNQCLGLAEALNLQVTFKPVKARFPWIWIPSVLWINPLSCVNSPSALQAPWPKVVIGGGRVSAAPVAAIRKHSHNQTMAIQLLNPGLNPNRYDLIIAPVHDQLYGDNVLQTLGPLHRVTRQKLYEARVNSNLDLNAYTGRVATILIGGPSKHYQFGMKEMIALVQELKDLSKQGYYLLITVSRRTHTACRTYLKTQMQNLPASYWDGDGENPYFLYLSLADVIMVTCDSISMTAEAASTGKPVYVYPLPGSCRKFSRFFNEMIQHQHIRVFRGDLTPYQVRALNDIDAVRQKVLERFPGIQALTKA